jgi:hypothetical protein
MRRIAPNVLIRTSLVAIGLIGLSCSSDDQRLVELATQGAERQAEQNVQMAELQQQVAEGAKRLVEEDARARRELAEVQNNVQAERAEVGRQRDLLETDRRELAAQRRWDPVIAAAIADVGLVLACLLPLILCLYLLRSPPDTEADQAIAELLIEDVAAQQPILLSPPPTQPRLAPPADDSASRK